MKNRIFSSPFSRLTLSSLFLLFLTFFAASIASAQIPSTGLVGYWPFNGNANDESGNGNNGTVNGATLATDRFGNLNAAYSFSGGSNIQIPNSVGWMNSTGLTISGWVYFNSVVSGSVHTFFDLSDGMCDNCWGYRYSCVLDAGAIWFGREGALGGIGFSINGNYTLTPNSWIFISTIIDGNTAKLYINGQLANTASANTLPLNLQLGASNSKMLGTRTVTNGQNNLNGKLDDISIYNRALTPAEITQIYTDQTSTVATPPCPTLATNLQTGLVGYWPFCGNANDESGNGNNGTVNGATLTTDRFGNANSAYSFDGVNDYILTNSFNLNLNSTVSFWIKASNTIDLSAATTQSNSGATILSKGASNSPCNYSDFAFGYKSGNYGNGEQNCSNTNWFETELGAGCNFNYVSNCNSNMQFDNSWQQVTIKFKANRVIRYLNGAVVDSIADTFSSLNNSGFPFSIGARYVANMPGLTLGHWKGEIDDICVWSRLLSSNEIAQNFTPESVPCTPFLGEDQTVCAGTSVTLSASGSSLACPTLPSTLQTGLVGYWPFCGNANDASGNGNNGTVNGATLTTDRFGNANSAYSFDGSPDRIELGQNLGTPIGSPNSSWSCSAWINRNNYNGVIGISDYQGVGGNDNFFAVNLQVDQGVANAGIRSGSTEYNVTGGSITSSQWHLISFTVSQNGTMSLFVDGALITSTSINSSLNFYNNPFYRIGANNYMGTYNAGTGLIDEVLIYNRALTAAEIQQLYTLGQSTYLWSNGATTTTINVTPSTTTTYTCSVTDANGNVCTDSITVFVPQIEATDLTICAGETTTLSVSGINSTATPSACPTLPTNLQTGLVGYWPFCGNANDASGNGNNGTVNGATLTADRFGNANSSYSFDGVDDGITINPPQTLFSGDFSIHFNFKLYSSGGPDEQFMNNYGTAQPNVFQLFSSGNVMFRDNASNALTFNAPVVYTLNTWHDYTVVRNGAGFKHFIDGVLVYSNNYNLGSCANSFPIYLMSNPYFNAFVDGEMDELMLFNRALLDSEVLQISNLGQSNYLWSTGATTPIIDVTPTTTTTYTCTVTDANGNVCTDSVTVFVPQITSTDLTICAGESTTLSVSGINTAITPSACPTLPTNLQTGLVGYWPFCGNANDASGNGNNGTVNGATLTTDRFGNANCAYAFDGVNDYIELGPYILVQPQEYTIDLWAKFNNTTFSYLFGQATNGEIQLQLDGSGNVKSWNKLTNGGSVSAGTIVPDLTNWHHITAVFNNNTKILDFIIDGSVFSTIIPQGVNIQTFTGPALFGRQSNVNANFFNGQLDDIIIWNRAVTLQEIVQLNNVGQATYSWSNGATTPTIDVSPASTTTYTCTVTTNGVSCTDSVTVVVNNPTIDLGADVTVCGTSTTLTAPSGFDSYFWSNGGTTNTTTVTANGTYSCTVTQGGCSATDAIDVTLIDATITASDSIVCAGETVTLSVPQGGSTSTACAALPTNLQTGLVGYWPFCGNANDASGNGYNGVVNGATLTTDRFGNANQSFAFSTQGNVFSTPGQYIALNGITTSVGSYTIAGWINPSSYAWPGNSDLRSSIFSYDDVCSGNGGLRFMIGDNQQLETTVYSGGQWQLVSANNVISLNTWIHVATVISTNNISQYVNGALVSSSSIIGQPNLSGCFAFAENPMSNGHWYYFNGKLDDFGFWNRALDASELNLLYQQSGTAYSWSNGATTPTIDVSPASTTTYTCTVTKNGVSFTDSVTVVVSQPVVSITPNGIVEICQGESIALTANGGVSYLWSTGAPTQSITVNTEALYTVTVTDINGCIDTESQFVKVNQLPNIGVNNASICVGQSATLTATGGLSYVWSPATGLSATTGSTVSSSSITTAVYTVTGTGANGCANSATATVTVNAPPTATITPATATTFCQGGSVVLNANNGAGLTYQWFNNAVAIGATSSSYTANASGSYTVEVTNTSACSSTSNSIDVTTNANVDYFADADSDGFGDVATLVSTCIQPQGYVTDNTDCDDNDSNVNTAATELCNHIDDDCSGTIDDGLVFETYYADVDGDTFGDANNSIYECSQPNGYVTNNTDCNDNNANQNTASTEICNGEDDDCDGAIDNGITFLDYYADADGDGFGAGDVISSCSDLGAGYVSNNTDCDDSNSNINSSATETCNTIDDNCDGQIDEGVQTVYFIDNDGDTYGNPSVSILACVQPIGYTPDDNDCNDNDANINPGAEDIGGNGIDENCDGEIDNSIFELNTAISLYPNPTRSELNIQVNSSIIGNDLYIYDAVGKLVFKQQLLSTQTTVPVSNFADGNYVLRVGEVVKRVVVEK